MHLDALITVLDGSADAHMPISVGLSRTRREVEVQEKEKRPRKAAVWRLAASTHFQLTDRSQVDLFQGRDPAAKD